MRSGHWLVFALAVTMGTSLAAKEASNTSKKSPIHSPGLIPPEAQQTPFIDTRRKRVVEPLTPVIAQASEQQTPQQSKGRNSIWEVLGRIGDALVIANSEQPANRNGIDQSRRRQADLNGALMPGPDGGMIIGGPLDGSILPSARGGMIIGGPLDGTFWPGADGGMITGGPLDGSILPGARGGMIIGGPLDGTIMPGR